MYKIYSKLFVLPPGRAKQMIRVMKVVTLLIFLAVMQVSAASYAQKVTLSEKNATLTKVFNEIRQQSGFDFIMAQSVAEKARPVTIMVTNVELKDVLEQIFKDQPLEYEITDRSVLIREKAPTVLDKIKSALNLDKIDVRGQVVDENGQPLTGATVQVKGGNNSTITDAKGVFSLKRVDPGASLMVSFIGYDKQEVKAAEDIGVIRMKIAASQLDAVQVIAYGEQTQRFSVNDVVTVKAADIEKQNVNNPILALEGRVPGLNINQTSGIAGSGVKVRLEGQNSLAQSNSLLYVIDGVPYPSDVMDNSTDFGALTTTVSSISSVSNLLSYINPNDIESISILKDADATAIYGSRAANGAIIITTKKGKAGPSKVDFRVQQGRGDVAHFLPLLNAQQYLAMRHEAFKNDGATPGQYDFDLNGAWDTTRSTNWQKTLIGRAASYADYNVSTSGGTTLTQYLAGLTYHRETSVFPGDFSDKKGSFHFNISTSSSNERLKMSLTTNYLFDNNLLPRADLTSQALILPPDAPALFNSDGSLNWQQVNGGSTWNNPLQFLYAPDQIKTYNLILNGLISYEILPRLYFKVNIGYNNLLTEQVLKKYLEFEAPESQTIDGDNGRIMNTSNNSVISWITEPQLSYSRVFGRHKFDFLLGATINQSSSDGLYVAGYGFGSNALVGNLAAANSTLVLATTQAQYKYAALFGRLNYIYDDQVILNFSARKDGSSRFGPANRFHDFWSAGAGWIFTKQRLVRQVLPFLSFGKIKANYGTTGSDGIGDYQYMNLYSPVSYPNNYQGVTGLAPNGLPNPHLQWEEVRKLLIGIDLGLFEDRITLSADYIRNRSSNQLIGFQLPNTAGFQSIQLNLPAKVQNRSWEAALQSKNVTGKNFSWQSSFTITKTANKILSLPSAVPFGAGFIVNQPVGTKKVFHFLGVDPATGVYIFEDSHGNPTSNPNPSTDANTLLKPAGFPDFLGGLGNSFILGKFSLDVFMQFVKQKQVSYYYGTRIPGGGVTNQPTYVLTRWQRPGSVTNIQKFNQDYSLFDAFNNLSQSDALYSDGSFIRIKNVSLSYRFDQNLLQKAHIRDARIFIQGQNLFTITHYKGMDPETGTGGLPPLRVITIGANLGF